MTGGRLGMHRNIRKREGGPRRKSSPRRERSGGGVTSAWWRSGRWDMAWQASKAAPACGGSSRSMHG
jgi:hypothetical protein